MKNLLAAITISLLFAACNTNPGQTSQDVPQPLGSTGSEPATSQPIDDTTDLFGEELPETE